MLTRRPATDADIDFLLRLRQESMNPHHLAAGVELTEADHKARLMHRFDCAEVLVDQGRPVGLLKMTRDSNEWKIMQVQLAPSVQGRGLGRAVLEQVISEAAAARVTLALTVLKVNPARRLYERLGFQHVGEDDLEYHMSLPYDDQSAANAA